MLKRLDDELKEHLLSRTGVELKQTYTDFWRSLKEYRGNANGFTGLSEFLVFRFLYHLLERHLKTPFTAYRLTSDLRQFVAGDVTIGQSTPVQLETNKKVYPDISLYVGKDLLRIISIKIYLTSGVRTIETEKAMHGRLKSEYPDLKTLLLIYHGVPETGRIRQKLDQACSDGFRSLILERCGKPLADELTDWLPSHLSNPPADSLLASAT